MKLSDLKLTPTGEAATKKLVKQVHKSTVAAALEPKLRLGVIGIEIGQTQSTGDTSRTNESTTMKIDDLLSEAKLNEGYAIKLKSGNWYSEELPSFSGPVKSGNSQVRVFKTMDAADDFLIKQQSSKFGGKKFEDAEIVPYRKKKVKEERAAKGVWVIKNKDGVERRFKDDESAAAIAWKNSSSPSKVKVAVHSQAYWEKKEEAGAVLLPWSRITIEELADQFDHLSSEAGFGRVDDWTIGRHYEVSVSGVDTAHVAVRVAYSFGKEDDMGLDVEGDERISDSQQIIVRRDVTRPSKLVFAGYR